MMIIVASIFASKLFTSNTNQSPKNKNNQNDIDLIEEKVKLKSLKLDEKKIDFTKNTVRYLADEKFGGRRTGTAYEAETALFLANKLKEFGLQPLGENDTYFQSFPIDSYELVQRNSRSVFHRLERNNVERLSGDNVLGLIPSSERTNRYILISAHHDHLGIIGNYHFPGANDNASGVTAVLQIAEELSKNKYLPYSIIIAFWSGEEMGLLGSRYFVENPTVILNNIKLCINLDSIGSGKDYDFIFWGEKNLVITDLIKNFHSWEGGSFEHQSQHYNSSDHAPFAGKEIPALTILAANWLESNHTVKDTYHLINSKKIVYLSEIIKETVSAPEVAEILNH